MSVSQPSRSCSDRTSSEIVSMLVLRRWKYGRTYDASLSSQFSMEEVKLCAAAVASSRFEIKRVTVGKG